MRWKGNFNILYPNDNSKVVAILVPWHKHAMHQAKPFSNHIKYVWIGFNFFQFYHDCNGLSGKSKKKLSFFSLANRIIHHFRPFQLFKKERCIWYWQARPGPRQRTPSNSLLFKYGCQIAIQCECICDKSEVKRTYFRWGTSECFA